MVYFRVMACILINVTIFSSCANNNFYNELKATTQLSDKELKQILDWLNKAEKASAGWSAYYHIVPEFINKFNLKVGCEIGVAFGRHSYAILQKTKLQKLYSIDPYRHFEIEEYDDIQMNLSQKYFDVLYFKVKNLLSIFGNRSQLIRKPSTEAAYLFELQQLDFVFIDGNHSYKAVIADLQAWYDKVRSKGFIIGDDYAPEFPGLIQAVNEFFKAKNIQVNRRWDYQRTWWVIKP